MKGFVLLFMILVLMCVTVMGFGSINGFEVARPVGVTLENDAIVATVTPQEWTIPSINDALYVSAPVWQFANKLSIIDNRWIASLEATTLHIWIYLKTTIGLWGSQNRYIQSSLLAEATLMMLEYT